MIALIQRVARAEVGVAGATIGSIGAGLLVFVCAEIRSVLEGDGGKCKTRRALPLRPERLDAFSKQGLQRSPLNAEVFAEQDLNDCLAFSFILIRPVVFARDSLLQDVPGQGFPA